MNPELVAILTLGLILIGLLITFWRDARADYEALREDNNTLRAEVRAEFQDQRADVNSQFQDLRAELHADNQRLRQDVQTLTERTARLEGVVQSLVATSPDRDRRDDAA